MRKLPATKVAGVFASEEITPAKAGFEKDGLFIYGL